jgi:flagellar hook assembly protein FlgD
VAGNEGESAHTNTGVVSAEDTGAPARFALHSVTPNPVSGDALIRFDLPVSSPVKLRIYDARGRLVKVGLDGSVMLAGRHRWVWDGRDNHGRRVSPGVYLYRLDSAHFAASKKLVVLD